MLYCFSLFFVCVCVFIFFLYYESQSVSLFLSSSLSSRPMTGSLGVNLWQHSAGYQYGTASVYWARQTCRLAPPPVCVCSQTLLLYTDPDQTRRVHVRPHCPLGLPAQATPHWPFGLLRMGVGSPSLGHALRAARRQVRVFSLQEPELGADESRGSY